MNRPRSRRLQMNRPRSCHHRYRGYHPMNRPRSCRPRSTIHRRCCHRYLAFLLQSVRSVSMLRRMSRFPTNRYQTNCHPRKYHCQLKTSRFRRSCRHQLCCRRSGFPLQSVRSESTLRPWAKRHELNLCHPRMNRRLRKSRYPRTIPSHP
jgi:hypothetical protein